MPEPLAPQELPARVLTDPEMIDACRVRDFSRIFRLLKMRAGLYPSAIARRCDLTPSRVGEVMAGRRQLLHMDVVERIADGLRIPGRMLGLACRPWETPPALTTEVAEPVIPTGDQPAPPSFPGAEVDGILAIASRNNPSPSTLQALQASIADYWRRDDQHGGEVLRPAVVGQLRYVVALLDSTWPEPIHQGLYAVAAELARLTGWTYFDARQYNQARTYFTQALQLAKTNHDRQFMANVLACMSLQATYQDRPGDALALVTAAQDQARASAASTPRVLSMLAIREAFAHATLGNRSTTHRAISDAHRQFDQVGPDDPDPAWIAYFDEAKLTVDTGIAHGRLGEAATGERLITDAMRREDGANRRGRAFHAFWLARTQLQLGKLDQACKTATEALDRASALTSERVRGHLREFYDQLAPYRHEPVVAAFDARLRQALPAQVSEHPRP